MTPEATRNLLIRRRELTGETFNDNTIRTWSDLLAQVDYPDAVEALNQAATEHERINARSLHEHLPARPRPELAPLGQTDCSVCDATGFAPLEDGYGNTRYAPCPSCRHTEAVASDWTRDPGTPVQFACMDPAAIAERRAHHLRVRGMAPIAGVTALPDSVTNLNL